MSNKGKGRLTSIFYGAEYTSETLRQRYIKLLSRVSQDTHGQKLISSWLDQMLFKSWEQVDDSNLEECLDDLTTNKASDFIKSSFVELIAIQNFVHDKFKDPWGKDPFFLKKLWKQHFRSICTYIEDRYTAPPEEDEEDDPRYNIHFHLIH